MPDVGASTYASFQVDIRIDVEWQLLAISLRSQIVSDQSHSVHSGALAYFHPIATLGGTWTDAQFQATPYQSAIWNEDRA
jgi:hypothetical protein